jgi:hypothetical protein
MGLGGLLTLRRRLVRTLENPLAYYNIVSPSLAALYQLEDCTKKIKTSEPWCKLLRE